MTIRFNIKLVTYEKENLFKNGFRNYITLLVMIGTNICNSFKKETLSDLVLSNVEALANSRENGDKTWTAPRTIACDYQQGPWHTASIERICEFCVTPNSCTPRACGM